MKKTKIICTIGPASCEKETLRQMIEKGMDVARINLAHADHSFCEKVINNIRELNQEMDNNIAIMLDIAGPDLRVGRFKDGSAKLEANSIIRIVTEDIIGDKAAFTTNYKDLYNDVRPDDKILLDDGLIELIVLSIDGSDILCRVGNEGIIQDHKGVNVPNCKLNIDFLSPKDREDIDYALKMGVDYLAISFVRSSLDVLEVNDLLIEKNNDHVNIITKIETVNAVEEIDDIIRLSDGIMIARGDLGVEVPLEKIPSIQKDIIEKCYLNNKISIVATEMLASMQLNKRPTRAEVSDVANAVLDGADAVMLSGETTIGHYPVETVDVMSRIIESTEEDINYLELLDKAMEIEKQDITTAIAYSVVDSAIRLRPKCIVVSTRTGYTARKISRFRPNCPIIAMSPNPDTITGLALNWGVYPVLVNEYQSTDEIINNSKQIAHKMMGLEPGDIIIVTGEFPISTVKHTNFMKIEQI